MFYFIYLELKIIEGLFLIFENNYVKLVVSWYYICLFVFSLCLFKIVIDGYVIIEYIDWEMLNIIVFVNFFVEIWV